MAHDYLHELNALLRGDASPDVEPTPVGGVRRRFLPCVLQLADGPHPTCLGGHLLTARRGDLAMLLGVVLDDARGTEVGLRVVELPVIDPTSLHLATFLISRTDQEFAAAASAPHAQRDQEMALWIHHALQMAQVYVDSGHHRLAWRPLPNVAKAVGDRLPFFRLSFTDRLTRAHLATAQAAKFLERIRSWLGRDQLQLRTAKDGLLLPEGYFVAMVNNMVSPIPPVLMRHGDKSLAFSRFMDTSER